MDKDVVITDDRTQWEVKAVDNRTAQYISVSNHYLHRKAPCSAAYGLFVQGKIKGIIIYGCPASSTLKNGICGEDEAAHVTELKRLWIDDSVENYPESFLISQSLKQMKKDCPDLDIIVSYADAGYNHIGVVYQATNWIYTGLSTPFNDLVLKGDDRDHLTQADELKQRYGSVAAAREILGGGAFTYKERSLKHRYIKFNGNKTRNKILLKKLQYEVQKYPKSGQPVVKIKNKVKFLTLDNFIEGE